jgi:hypothetical protein
VFMSTSSAISTGRQPKEGHILTRDEPRCRCVHEHESAPS